MVRVYSEKDDVRAVPQAQKYCPPQEGKRGEKVTSKIAGVSNVGDIGLAILYWYLA